MSEIGEVKWMSSMMKFSSGIFTQDETVSGGIFYRSYTMAVRTYKSSLDMWTARHSFERSEKGRWASVH